jgi:hypothetical protein
MLFLLLLLLPRVLGGAPDTTRPCNEVKPDRCPTGVECSKLGVECMECSCPSDCTYGRSYEANCTVHPDIECIGGERNFRLPFNCRYCYQVKGLSTRNTNLGSDDTICRTTKIEALQFLTSDKILVVRHKICVIRPKIRV